MRDFCSWCNHTIHFDAINHQWVHLNEESDVIRLCPVSGTNHSTSCFLSTIVVSEIQELPHDNKQTEIENLVAIH